MRSIIPILIVMQFVVALLSSNVALAQPLRLDVAPEDPAAFTAPAQEPLPVFVEPIERLPSAFDSCTTPATNVNEVQFASSPMENPDVGDSGMGGLSMGGPGMGGPGYSVIWYPSSPVSHSSPATNMGIVRQNLSIGFPLWTDGHDMLMLSTSVQNSLFSTDAVLPDSHRAFPNELWNINIGTNYMHKFDNGWMGMAGINFGSASDKPFHGIDEMTLGFMSLLQVPAKNKRDNWNFMLMYSPTGNLNFPFPGVAYLWKPSDGFHASIGIPFSIRWQPTDALSFDVSYMPLVTVNATATYKLAEQLSLYGGFQSLQEAYLLADRENINDRFMGFERRLLAGVRWEVCRHATFDVSGGYVFDRYYGVGQNQIGGNLSDQINIDPGAFVSLSLQYCF